MGIDDFNMYFSGSYVKTQEGNLAYVEHCDGDGDVRYNEYSSRETCTHKHCRIGDVEGRLKLEAFDPKPFCSRGSVFSPSFRSVRGYKDGVNTSRLDMNCVLGSHSGSDSSFIIDMFFEPVVSNEEGISKIAKGESEYACLADDILIVKSRPLQSLEDFEPLLKISVTHDGETSFYVNDGAETHTISTTAGSRNFVAIPSYLTRKQQELLGKLSVTMKAHVPSWREGSMPKKIRDNHREWIVREEERKSEVPKIDVYRQGTKVCNLLEPIDPQLVGLKKLTNKIGELKNEYSKACRA